ncbi:hypothetical protein AUK22_01835 [bacterium CG2_30_54_10]|nr:MAG: hypothetical protein AUK22_01835 [bacterium CG2_30_54_10]
MFLGLALALAQIKLFQLPNGGSVSIGVFPIMVLGARRGPGSGVVVGMLLGLLSAALRPYVVHPLQFILDYPLAFGCLGLAGLWSWSSGVRAAAATFLANLFRLSCHVSAGVLAGGTYFPDSRMTTPELAMASLLYNLGHMLPETVICAALAIILSKQQPALVSRQR